jgi:hypothetical protein
MHSMLRALRACVVADTAMVAIGPAQSSISDELNKLCGLLVSGIFKAL